MIWIEETSQGNDCILYKILMNLSLYHMLTLEFTLKNSKTGYIARINMYLYKHTMIAIGYALFKTN